MSAGPSSDHLARGARFELALLFAGLFVAGHVWAPLLDLSLTGEDYAILARLRSGTAGSEHVTRPWVDALLFGVHRLFGVSSPVPYHLTSLALHFANVVLVYALVRHVLTRVGSAAGGAGGAALAAAFGFALAGASFDALAWTAAVNRPLSTLGALLAWNGLVRFRAERAAPFVFLTGLVLQYGANEEVYGTLAFTTAWLVALARQPGAGRRLALGTAVGTVLVAAALFPFRDVPGGGTGSILERGWSQLGASFLRRMDGVGAGFGLGGSATLALTVAAALALAALGHVRASLVLASVWLASFVPFVLSDPTGYRLYPTVCATALVIGAGVGALFERLAAEPIGAWRERRTGVRAAGRIALVGVLGAGAFFASTLASTPYRDTRLARWREAVAEIAACREPVRTWVESGRDLPWLANLDTTTAGLFLYAFELDRAALEPRLFGFLDGATAFAGLTPEARARFEGPWFGRRCDGSVGTIEPDSYFSGRASLGSYVLYSDVVRAAGPDEARALVRDIHVDLARTVVVETSSAIAPHLGLSSASSEAGTVEIVRPWAVGADQRSATIRLRVRAPGARVLACFENVLFDPRWRFAKDQTIFSGLAEQRAIGLSATGPLGEVLPTFHANVHGLGVLVPGGDVEIELAFALLKPELKR